MKVDYLIVGSGLTGTTIARHLADAGREVLVVDRRSDAGGNVHDHVHESGIVIHTYGPHYFRTGSDSLWDYANRFASFRKFEARIQSIVDGTPENWPIAASYIRRTVGTDWAPAFSGVPSNFEEASLAMMPRLIYEKFVKGYTEKQWGVPATTLSPRLARRFDVRSDDEPRLTRHKHQGIPIDGYSAWMQNMLSGIPLRLNFDYLENRAQVSARRLLVFTGPIDEFFDFSLGRLKYRSQRRQVTYLCDRDYAQVCGQANNPAPDNGAHIRTLEWKHMMAPGDAARAKGTVLTTETPYTPDDPDSYEYPFPDDENDRLFEGYKRLAAEIPKLLICGRLGEYRYYDMDQAIGRAMKLAQTILSR